MKLRIGIAGWGNVSRGAALAAAKSRDVELVCVWTRRPDAVEKEVEAPVYLYTPGAPVIEATENVDVVLLCGGSKKHLMEMGPAFAEVYNTVDSFDTHDLVDQYREKMERAVAPRNRLSLICTGWDPGIFSFMRVYQTAFLPGYRSYAFYGLKPEGGLSMGHSDALRSLEGVLDARSYTHANQEAINEVLAGKNPQLGPGDMHWRENIVVAEDGADLVQIEKAIRTMPNYFAPYTCAVKFITAEEMAQNHTGMRHDGCVIVSGETSPGHKAVMEFRCAFDSNPEATGSIMLAYARAAQLICNDSLTQSRVWTPLDVAPWITHCDKESAIKMI